MDSTVILILLTILLIKL